MKRLAPVLCILLSGCIITQDSRPPAPVSVSAAPATIAPLPRVKVVVGDQYRVDGLPQRNASSAQGEIFRSYERVAAENLAFRSIYAQDGEPVHYVLFIDTIVNERGRTWAIVSGVISLMLFPAQTRTDFVVQTSLFEAATGERISVREAKTGNSVFMWLPLIPIAPLTLALAPSSRDLYDPNFQDVFAMLASDLNGRPLPEPVAQDRIDISPENQFIHRGVRAR